MTNTNSSKMTWAEFADAIMSYVPQMQFAYICINENRGHWELTVVGDRNVSKHYRAAETVGVKTTGIDTDDVFDEDSIMEDAGRRERETPASIVQARRVADELHELLAARGVYVCLTEEEFEERMESVYEKLGI